MFEQTFKNIDDILHKDSGCSSELDYVEQLEKGLPFIATKDIGFDSIIDYENDVKIPYNNMRNIY